MKVSDGARKMRDGVRKSSYIFMGLLPIDLPRLVNRPCVAKAVIQTVLYQILFLSNTWTSFRFLKMLPIDSVRHLNYKDY